MPTLARVILERLNPVDRQFRFPYVAPPFNRTAGRTMTSLPAAENEFSRLLPRDELGLAVLQRQIEADGAERAALAERFGLQALERLSADLTIQPRGPIGLLEVTGRLKAKVVQSCIVTLEPVESDIDADFLALYTLRPAELLEDEDVIDPEAPDLPEPVGPKGLDLGEIVAQQLAVLLDPYPRLAGAELPEPASDAADEARESSPFAVLKELKR